MLLQLRAQPENCTHPFCSHATSQNLLTRPYLAAKEVGKRAVYSDSQHRVNYGFILEKAILDIGKPLVIPAT